MAAVNMEEQRSSIAQLPVPIQSHEKGMRLLSKEPTASHLLAVYSKHLPACALTGVSGSLQPHDIDKTEPAVLQINSS